MFLAYAAVSRARHNNNLGRILQRTLVTNSHHRGEPLQRHVDYHAAVFPRGLLVFFPLPGQGAPIPLSIGLLLLLLSLEQIDHFLILQAWLADVLLSVLQVNIRLLFIDYRDNRSLLLFHYYGFWWRYILFG